MIYGGIGVGGGAGGGRTPSGITAATAGQPGESGTLSQPGGAGAAGAAIRRTAGLTLTITNNGTIIGDQTATGVA